MTEFRVPPGICPDMREHGWEHDHTWNCMHLVRMLKQAGGIPNEGNDREAWEAGERFGFNNPDGIDEG